MPVPHLCYWLNSAYANVYLYSNHIALIEVDFDSLNVLWGDVYAYSSSILFGYRLRYFSTAKRSRPEPVPGDDFTGGSILPELSCVVCAFPYIPDSFCYW